MKRYISLLAIVFIAAASYAQELGSNEHYGTIIFPNGTESEVVLLENLELPWDFQKKITVVDRDVFDSGIKIKGKHKTTYKAKDLQGFKIGSQLYETQKYSDMSSLGMGSIATNYFLEVYEKGKVTLYKYYQEPYLEEGSGPVTEEELNQKFRLHPQILIHKEGEKVKDVTTAKLEPYFGDNVKVMEKYNNGGYGNKAKDESKSGAGKLLDRLTESNDEFIKEMVIEYNSESVK